MKVYVIKGVSDGKYFQVNKYNSWGDFVGARVWTKKGVASWVRNFRFKGNPDIIVEELVVNENTKENPEKLDIRKVYPFQIILV